MDENDGFWKGKSSNQMVDFTSWGGGRSPHLRCTILEGTSCDKCGLKAKREHLGPSCPLSLATNQKWQGYPPFKSAKNSGQKHQKNKTSKMIKSVRLTWKNVSHLGRLKDPSLPSFSLSSAAARQRLDPQEAPLALGKLRQADRTGTPLGPVIVGLDRRQGQTKIMQLIY